MMWIDAYLQNKVLAADPVELIRLLYQEAIESVRRARRHLAEGDVRARSADISKSMEILIHLNASLDLEHGGEIAANLARLYRYMHARLVEANLKQSDAPLAETLDLLTTLAEAWDGVKAPVSADAAAERPGSPGPEAALPDTRSVVAARFGTDSSPRGSNNWTL